MEKEKRKCTVCGKTLVPLRKVKSTYKHGGTESYCDWDTRSMHVKCFKNNLGLLRDEIYQAFFNDKFFIPRMENEKAIKSQSIRDLKGIRNETEPLFDSV